MQTHNPSPIAFPVHHADLHEAELRKSALQQAALHNATHASSSSALLTFALSCAVLVASGAGAYFVALAPSDATLERLQAETERMSAVHAAEMGALRARVHRLDVQILAAKSALAIEAQKNEANGANKSSRSGSRTPERNAVPTGREPRASAQAPDADGLDGLDGPGDDPLDGLHDPNLARKQKPKRR